MYNDLVTVIIPAYNAAATIEETLWSVVDQTYSNLEILVVDDGSTDATAEIVRTFAARDARVRLITQPNGGVAVARNRGIAEAKGEFVAPVDADDLWRPDKIRKQMVLMKERGESVGLVYTWYALIDIDGKIVSTDHRPNHDGESLERMCRGNLIGNGSGALMRRSALREVGGYDPTLRERGAQGCEDYDIYLSIAERYDFAVVQEHLTGYRYLPGNMSSDILQMVRSKRIVTLLFRQKYPQYAHHLDDGWVEFLRWSFLRAVRERSLAAAGLVWIKLFTEAPPRALSTICSMLFWHLHKRARTLRSTMRPAEPAAPDAPMFLPRRGVVRVRGEPPGNDEQEWAPRCATG
jgi:glycosyltransferase involved in cell wall biosynthesis